MTSRVISIVLLFLSTGAMPAANDLSRPQFNWMLNCQGCHGAQGKVAAIDTPVLHNNVGTFLSVDGGREYLVSVPGVVNAPINDKDKADLLTWIINKLDPGHRPDDFKPFSAEEIKWGRENPLLIRAPQRRAELMIKMGRSPEIHN